MIHMSNSQRRIYVLYRFSLLILVLNSLYAWFLWERNIFVLLFCTVISLLLFLICKNIFTLNKSNFLPIVLLIFIQLYVGFGAGLNAIIGGFLRIIIITGVVLLTNKIKVDIFFFFTKYLSKILFISLIGWILYLFGFNLPSYLSGENYGGYENYYFFLRPLRSSIIEFPRFSSIFLEPSYLGMMSTFLIISNRFDFRKKPVIILLIATMLSFSLAAYIVLFVTYSISLVLDSKNPIRNMLLIFLFCTSCFFIILNYASDESAIIVHVLNRLDFSGDVARNSRYSHDFESYYQTFFNSFDKYFGLGQKKFSSLTFYGGNAGYKVFIMVYGIIGTILVALMYLSVVLLNRTRTAWILLLAFAMIFMQASYALLEFWLLFLFISVPMLKETLGNYKNINLKGNLSNLDSTHKSK